MLLDVQDGGNGTAYEVARLAPAETRPPTPCPSFFVTAMHPTEGERAQRGTARGGRSDTVVQAVQTPRSSAAKVQVFSRSLPEPPRALADEKSRRNKATLAELDAFKLFHLARSAALRLAGPPRRGSASRSSRTYGDKARRAGRKDFLDRIRAAALRMGPADRRLAGSCSRMTRQRDDVRAGGSGARSRTAVGRRAAERTDPGAATSSSSWPSRRDGARRTRGCCASALENLLRNAWKFTSKKPQRRASSLGRREGGPFFVRDDGAGGFDVPRHAPTASFSRFQRMQLARAVRGHRPSVSPIVPAAIRAAPPRPERCGSKKRRVDQGAMFLVHASKSLKSEAAARLVKASLDGFQGLRRNFQSSPKALRRCLPRAGESRPCLHN